MLKRLLNKLGKPSEFARYDGLAEKIHEFDLSGLSHAQLHSYIGEYKQKFAQWLKEGQKVQKAKHKQQEEQEQQEMQELQALQVQETADNTVLNAILREWTFAQGLLAESYAVTKELCKRCLGLEAYDSQLLTGIALHFGNIAELPTGEGKTMAAVFPAVVNALAGKGVHVLTFNDYLAKRDAQWMKDIYENWGLRVDFIQEAMGPERRREAYMADITYVTPKEAGFDFLRDSLVYSRGEKVQRAFNYVIVDEADSIMIDEARVPLVIAGKPEGEAAGMDVRLVKAVESLCQGVDYMTDENLRNVYLTDRGINSLEKLLNCGNLYDGNVELLTFINNLLHARALLKKDIDYIVRDNRVEIVDEFTGRVADKRKWHDGLQMAVEALEGIEHDRSSRILGKITLQNFISLYPEISGMTATALSSSEELLAAYNRRVYEVQPHKKCIRMDHADEVFTHREAKEKAIIAEITSVHETGRPILIGTSSVEESEKLAASLVDRRVACVVLNARNDAQEAEIIARAGRLGAVTVSTNMAGRGVDIKLGDGDPGSEETRRVIALGGLYVIGTNKNECIRLDNQLRGRAGRQGDPGASRFFVSLEDQLLTRFGIEKELPAKYLGVRQEARLEDSRLNSLINHIQRVIDGQNFDIRKSLGKYSLLLEYQRRMLAQRREEIMDSQVPSLLLSSRDPQIYGELCSQYGKEHVEAVSRKVAIHCVDECWYDFLEFCEGAQEGIELVRASKKDPLDEYRKQVIEEFDLLMTQLEDTIADELEKTDFALSEDELAAKGFNTPTATWTYIINDNIKVKRFSLLGFL